MPEPNCMNVGTITCCLANCIGTEQIHTLRSDCLRDGHKRHLQIKSLLKGRKFMSWNSMYRDLQLLILYILKNL